ncbi:MAG: methyltransferase domain-containing protein [Candidatus Methanomethyliaceae archaeon]|nr:methyltransferase domain-containing protein [Candidatus Methanomethyliaceae archaeon]
MSQFDWKGYIRNLEEIPSLKEQWEKDFVEVLENIRKKIEKTRILEVGCSNGRWLRWFFKHYQCETHGIDLEGEGFVGTDSIKSFIKGDAQVLPYKDGAFDLVFSMGLIEHFKKNERHRILEEQNRVLSKGGLLVCIVPNLHISLEYFRVKVFYDGLRGYNHYVVRKEELEQIFQELGLKIIYFDFIGIFRKFAFLKSLKRTELFKVVLSDNMLCICKK